MRRAARLIVAAAALAAGTPALALPNAFWMFGWRADYNHGTGGFADAERTRGCRPSACRAEASPARSSSLPMPVAAGRLELAMFNLADGSLGGVGQ